MTWHLSLGKKKNVISPKNSNSVSPFIVWILEKRAGGGCNLMLATTGEHNNLSSV
jgi:hypothetical protein